MKRAEYSRTVLEYPKYFSKDDLLSRLGWVERFLDLVVKNVMSLGVKASGFK